MDLSAACATPRLETENSPQSRSLRRKEGEKDEHYLRRPSSDCTAGESRPLLWDPAEAGRAGTGQLLHRRLQGRPQKWGVRSLRDCRLAVRVSQAHANSVMRSNSFQGRHRGPPGGIAQACRATISFLCGFAADVGLSRMTGPDYIAFAAKLAATYAEAASCRSAISRAYYGAFRTSERSRARDTEHE